MIPSALGIIGLFFKAKKNFCFNPLEFEGY